MFLEEPSYKIEIRKGVLHGNADGMSRGCHGSGCICDELLAYERKYNVKKGQIIEGEVVVLGRLSSASISFGVSHFWSLDGSLSS